LEVTRAGDLLVVTVVSAILKDYEEVDRGNFSPILKYLCWNLLKGKIVYIYDCEQKNWMYRTPWVVGSQHESFNYSFTTYEAFNPRHQGNNAGNFE